MKLDFPEQRFQIDPNHDWGYQVRLANTKDYAAKLLVMTNSTPGSLHHHNADKAESFIVLSGKVCVDLPDGKHNLVAGDVIHIPHYIMHRHSAPDAGEPCSTGSDCFKGQRVAVILEVSTHDDDAFTQRIDESKQKCNPNP